MHVMPTARNSFPANVHLPGSFNMKNVLEGLHLIGGYKGKRGGVSGMNTKTTSTPALTLMTLVGKKTL